MGSDAIRHAEKIERLRAEARAVGLSPADIERAEARGRCEMHTTTEGALRDAIRARACAWGEREGHDA